MENFSAPNMSQTKNSKNSVNVLIFLLYATKISLLKITVNAADVVSRKKIKKFHLKLKQLFCFAVLKVFSAKKKKSLFFSYISLPSS